MKKFIFLVLLCCLPPFSFAINQEENEDKHLEFEEVDIELIEEVKFKDGAIFSIEKAENGNFFLKPSLFRNNVRSLGSGHSNGGG